jgi:hypothetical protein
MFSSKKSSAKPSERAEERAYTALASGMSSLKVRPSKTGHHLCSRSVGLGRDSKGNLGKSTTNPAYQRDDGKHMREGERPSNNRNQRRNIDYPQNRKNMPRSSHRERRRQDELRGSEHQGESRYTMKAPRHDKEPEIMKSQYPKERRSETSRTPHRNDIRDDARVMKDQKERTRAPWADPRSIHQGRNQNCL